MKWLVCLLSLTVMSVAQAATLDCVVSYAGQAKPVQTKVELKDGKATLKTQVELLSYEVKVDVFKLDGKSFYNVKVNYNVGADLVTKQTFFAPMDNTSFHTFIPNHSQDWISSYGTVIESVLLGCSVK